MAGRWGGVYFSMFIKIIDNVPCSPIFFRVSCVTGASNWYWLTVGQGLLSQQQVWVEGECLFSSLSPLSLSLIYSTISLFSLSLGDETKWPIRADVSLNPNTIIFSFFFFFFCKISLVPRNEEKMKIVADWCVLVSLSWHEGHEFDVRSPSPRVPCPHPPPPPCYKLANIDVICWRKIWRHSNNYKFWRHITVTVYWFLTLSMIMPQLWKTVSIILSIQFLIQTKIKARKDDGNDVYIQEKIRTLVIKTLMEMDTGFDKEPLQSVEFRCKNRATQKLLSQFPNALVRWLHNGENIAVRTTFYRSACWVKISWNKIKINTAVLL